MWDLPTIAMMNQRLDTASRERRKIVEEARKKVEVQDHAWEVRTDKGDFYISVVGRWTEAEALEKLQTVLQGIKLKVNEQVKRRRPSGPEDNRCTIVENPDAKSGLGYEFMAGKALWYAMDMGGLYEQQMKGLTKVKGRK
jgi:hypothetical protein